MGKESDLSATPICFERPPPSVPGFKLVRLIGFGSYGEVWLGQDVLGQWRAVKVVHRARLLDDEPYEREFRGIKAYAEIAGEEAGLLRVYFAGREDTQGYFYYAMELADPAEPPFTPETYQAHTLKLELAQAPNRDNRREKPEIRPALASPCPLPPAAAARARHRLPFKQCLNIAREVATALGYLHRRKLVHRDVKPSNIVFIRDEAKLADIGLVAKMEMSLSQVGAAHYLPQEGAGTSQGDLYALGKVLYEMSTGLPVDKFPALPILRQVPKEERKSILELNRVFLKACATKPRDRYENAEEMIRDLDYLDAGSSLRARRQLKLALICSAMAILALAITAVAREFWLRSREGTRLRMILAADSVRKSLRQSGWFTNNLNWLGQAGKIRWDSELANQAATILAGQDVCPFTEFENIAGSSLAFDSKGRLLAGGLSNAPAQLWRKEDPNFLEQLPLTGHGPVAFGVGGEPLQFVPASPDKFVLRAARTGQALREFKLAGDAAAGADGEPVLALASDGSKVAAAVKFSDSAGRFAVWHTATGEPIGQEDEAVTALAFAPDGNYLAFGNAKGLTVVKRLPTMEKVATFRAGRAAIQSLTFGSDLVTSCDVDVPNRHRWLLAAGDAGGTIAIWEVASERLKSFCLGSHYKVFALAFDPEGTILASGGRGPLHLWDVASGRKLLAIPPRHSRPVDYSRALAFSPDSSLLAAVNKPVFGGSALVLLKMDPSRGIQTLRGLASQVGRVWWSADGKRIAGLAHNWNLAVWDMPSGQLLRVFEASKGGFADNAAVAFFSDGRRAAYASGHEALLLDLNKGEVLRRWPLPLGLADRLRYVDESTLLLLRRESWTGAGGRSRWRMRNLLRTDSNPLTPVFEQTDTNWIAYDTAFGTHGDYFLVQGASVTDAETNTTFRVLNLSDGRQILELRTQVHLYNTAPVLDPRGRFFSYIANPGTSRLVRLPAGELMGTVRDGPSAVSPTGEHFALGNPSGGCLFYDRGGSARGLTLAMDWRLTQIPEFSPDGSKLAWGTHDGYVLVANLDEVRNRLNQMQKGKR